MEGENDNRTDEQYREVLKDFERVLEELKKENKNLKEENGKLKAILYEVHRAVSGISL